MSRPPAVIYDATRVTELLGVVYTPEEQAMIRPAPKPMSGYITFFDPGWSILRLREAVKTRGRMFSNQDWYDTEAFARLDEQPCYRRLRLEPVPGSFDKTYDEQRDLLPEGEVVPLARVVVMGSVLRILGASERSFPDCKLRCADVDSTSRLVIVEHFDQRCLRLLRSWKEYHIPSLGLSSAGQP